MTCQAWRRQRGLERIHVQTHTPYLGDPSPGAEMAPGQGPPAWEGRGLWCHCCSTTTSLDVFKARGLPFPTLYPCLGQWDLSTPVPVILKAAKSLTRQTRACCLCAGIQPHPLQSFPDAVVRAIFLTLRSDRVCLRLQCLPLGQVHASQPGPP